MAIAVNKIDRLPLSEVMISSSSSLRTWMESIDLSTRTGTGACLDSTGGRRRNQERGQRVNRYRSLTGTDYCQQELEP